MLLYLRLVVCATSNAILFQYLQEKDKEKTLFAIVNKSKFC